jgi:hypothetical protein
LNDLINFLAKTSNWSLKSFTWSLFNKT